MFKDSAPSTTRVYMKSNAFFEQLASDIQKANQSVRIQCMSFEADQAGTKLIELLGSKPTIDRTLLIDNYSRYVVNDTFLYGPNGWLNKNNARSEYAKLDGLLEQARDFGIKIKFTNPIGFLMHRYPVRNHKKMVLIDNNISYLGGLNFTEHNFHWTDLMIRHEENNVAETLEESFLADWDNKSAPSFTKINNDIALYNLNGLRTRPAFQKLLDRIKLSDKVVAISPYISYPMLDAIATVNDNTVIVPANNNKPFMRFIHGLKRYSKINFKYVSGKMLHMKLLILDDEIAVYGSSNFDTISYLFEKEIILSNRNPPLVKQLNSFITRLIN